MSDRPRPRQRSAKEEDQRRRRAQLLDVQKQRRAELTMAARGVPPPAATTAPAEPPPPPSADLPVFPPDADDAESVVGDDDMESVAGGDDDAMQTSDGRRRRRRGRARADRPVAPAVTAASAALMGAEWMVDLPDDLASAWYVLARPAGWRCLVSTGDGRTVAQSRGGRARHFPSALPGGGRKGAGAGRCELDCVWVEATQTYFALDVLWWKGQRLVDCPADFRLWWLHSKLDEVRAGEATSSNPCRFVACPVFECTAAALAQLYDGASAAGSDGLLFLHRQALYEAGPSPLLLAWADARCSERFYDYGSEAMAKEIERDPEKAARWRTAEVGAAWAFADVLERVAAPPMEAAEPEAGAEAAPSAEAAMATT